MAEIICCLGLNTIGAIALLEYPKYEKCGYALIASTVLLVLALVFALLKTYIIPLVLNAAGTIAYAYTLAVLSGIPNSVAPRASVERLLLNHFPTVIVTLLLILLVCFTFFSPEQVEKRHKRKMEKSEKNNRNLADNERIV